MGRGTTLDAGRVVDAVERVCTTAATADDLLEGLSHTLHRTIPHDGSAWFGLDPVTMLATAPSRVEALRPEMCEPFWHYEFHEQDVGLFADLARGDGALGLRLALDGQPAKSIRYREVLRPQGYDDELRAVFRVGNRAWGSVALYREASRHPFSQPEVEAVRAISGVVGGALRSHIRALSPPVPAGSGPGLLVIDREGRIVSANQEAAGWLCDLWPVVAGRDEHGFDRDSLYDRRDRALEVPTPLFALVARARAVAEGRERPPSRLRLRDQRGRWLVLHASALSGRDRAGDEVALVIEAAKSAEIAPILIEAFSLTAREREVLSAITRGGTTAEIAAELYLSPHTVRDYVKAVFEKCGVSSRGELVARLFGEHYSQPLHATMVHVD
jgi:DNA-binding CsgD family transcriptional regulator